MVEKKVFGTLSDGRVVDQYVYTNKKGESVTMLNYGVMIHSICVAGRDGKLADVVCGAKDASQLETGRYLGQTIGRCANRIRDGKYTIKGHDYTLDYSPRPECLHSGRANYGKKIFDAEIIDDETVAFTYHEVDEIGFECDCDIKVTVAFNDASEFSMEYEMVADGDTILNPTNHAYFNLTGDFSDAREQELYLNCSNRAHKTGTCPDGGFVPVAGTPTDFTKMRKIAEAMDASDPYFNPNFVAYDEFFIVDRHPENEPAAVLYDPKSGRKMSIYSQWQGMVLFCASFGKAEPGKEYYGKNGQKYDDYCFTCLEPGFVPNAVNCPEFDSPVFGAGEVMKQKVVYAFSAE